MTILTTEENPLCRCGHYRREHEGQTDLGHIPCQGTVGADTCTCRGFRPAR